MPTELFLAGVSFSAELDPTTPGALLPIDGLSAKIAVCRDPRLFPRVHTLILAEGQRNEVQKLSPTLLDPDSDRSFRLEFAGSLDAVDAILDDREKELRYGGELPNYRGELARHTRMVPQTWILDPVREFLASPRGGYLLLTATAGFGKTAVTAQIVKELLADRPAALHLIKRDLGWDDPTAMLDALSTQIALAFNIHPRSIAATGSSPLIQSQNRFLELLRRAGGDPSDRGSLVVVIDGMDEAFGPEGRFAQVAFPGVLPTAERLRENGVKIILTSRPGEHLGWLAGSQIPHELALDARNQNQRSSIRQFLAEEAQRLSLPITNELLDQLADATEGAFVIARRFLDPEVTSREELAVWANDPSRIPRGIDGWLAEQWHRLFNQGKIPKELPIRAIVALLVAAREPLSQATWEELLAEAEQMMKRDPNRANDLEINRASPRNLRDVFGEVVSLLGSFLEAPPAGLSNESPVKFFHTRFGEFAREQLREGKGIDAKALDEAHRFLAHMGTTWKATRSNVARDYARKHVVYHGVQATLFDEIVEPTLTDLLFIEARAKADELAGLMADYVTAKASWPKRHVQTARDRVDSFHIFVGTHLRTLRFNEPVASIALNWQAGSPVRSAAVRLLLAEPMVPSRFRNRADVLSHCSLLCWNPLPLGPCRMVLEGHTDAVVWVKMLADAQRLVSASQDGSVRAWNLTTGESNVLAGRTGGLTSIDVSDDGDVVVTGSSDSTVRVWNLATGESRALDGHVAEVSTVTISVDGRQVVSGSDDGTLRLWDVTTGTSRVLDVHTSAVCATISVDGRLAVAGRSDGTLRVCNLETGASRLLKGHKAWVKSVTMSIDCRRAFTTSEDGTYRVWNLETGRSRQLWPCPCGIVGVAMSRDARIAVAGNSTLRLWNLDTGASQVLRGHTNLVRSVTLSRDERFAVSGSMDKTLRVWDLKTGESRALEGHTGEVNCVSMSDDRIVVSGSDDNTIRVWDLKVGESRVATNQKGCVNSVALSGDGRIAVIGNSDNTLTGWDLKTGKVWTFDGREESANPVTGVTCVSTSVDGRLVVSVNDYEVRVWDLANGKSGVLHGHSSMVTSVTIAIDGSTVVSASRDKTLRVWTLATGKSRVLKGHTHWVASATMSVDGKMAVSGSFDHTLRVWNVATGKSRVLKGHIHWVTSVKLFADDRMALSASADKTMRVWDLAKEQTTCVLEGHTDVVVGVELLLVRHAAISASYDKTLRVWNIATGECLAVIHRDQTPTAIACSRAPEKFAPAEALVLVGYANGYVERWLLSTNPANTRAILDLMPD